MRSLLAAALLLSACAPTAPPPTEPVNDPDSEDWVQLFDGQSLDGWIPKISGYPVGENYANTFRVQDGYMSVSYDEYEGEFNERFGHIFYKDPFSYYKFAAEYRFLGDQAAGGPGWATRNSGVMVHGQPAETMTVKQDFPISIEVQLLGGDGENGRTTSNLCTPGTNVVLNGKLDERHCISSTSKTYHGEQWVRAEIVVHGNEKIQHILDGEVVLEYTSPQIGAGNVDDHDPAQKVDGKQLESGSISLQSESHPIQFRKVEILNLVGCMDESSPNYKSYFVKSDPAACG